MRSEPRSASRRHPERVAAAGSSAARVAVRTVALASALIAPAATFAADAGESTVTSARGRDVTIIAGEDRLVYEIRQNGVLRQIRIVPDIGRPYYLVPADPTRAGDDLSTVDRLVPSWKLIEF
jgi:hypothetical protein